MHLQWQGPFISLFDNLILWSNMDWKWRTPTLLSPITTIPREYGIVVKALGLAISWQLLLLVCVLYLERVASFGEILCQNVQHPDHLRKYEHSVSSLPQPGQQFVKQNQFPTGLHQTLEHRSDFQHKEPRKKKKIQKHDPMLVSSSFHLYNITTLLSYPWVVLGAKLGRCTWRWSSCVSVSPSSGCLMRKLWLQHFFSSITMFRKPEELPRVPLERAL